MQCNVWKAARGKTIYLRTKKYRKASICKINQNSVAISVFSKDYDIILCFQHLFLFLSILFFPLAFWYCIPSLYFPLCPLIFLFVLPSPSFLLPSIILLFLTIAITFFVFLSSSFRYFFSLPFLLSSHHYIQTPFISFFPLLPPSFLSVFLPFTAVSFFSFPSFFPLLTLPYNISSYFFPSFLPSFLSSHPLSQGQYCFRLFSHCLLIFCVSSIASRLSVCTFLIKISKERSG